MDGDCNWTRTHNHLVHKGTLNHLAKLVKIKHLYQRLLPAIYPFLRLSDNESVIVSPVIAVYISRKKGEIDTVSFILHSSLAL